VTLGVRTVGILIVLTAPTSQGSGANGAENHFISRCLVLSALKNVGTITEKKIYELSKRKEILEDA
jgi:hypothetical protein